MSTKGQCHNLTLAKGYSDFKSKTFFLTYFRLIWTTVNMKAYGRIGKKVYINEAGHMTKMAAMPVYDKKFKNRLVLDRLTDELET